MINSKVVAKLTPKNDTQPHIIKMKVFWKTTSLWNEDKINLYRLSVYKIAEDLRLSGIKLTCEDFALRVLITFASDNGLPLKLKTGENIYKNMEIFDTDKNSNFKASPLGYADMVMTTFGAPDIQRFGENTIKLSSPDNIKEGDVLALAHDQKGLATGHRAHHIQVIVSRNNNTMYIYQGNSSRNIHRPLTWINRLQGKNAADPQDEIYAGRPIEIGTYTKNKANWDYFNNITKVSTLGFISKFDLTKWNFMEFNN